MTLAFALNIILSLSLLGSAVMFSKGFKCQYNPNTIISFFWFIFVFIPLILNPYKEINTFAILFIILSVGIFNFSSFFFPWHRISVKKNRIKFNFARLNKILWLSSSIALSCTLIDMKIQGLNIQDLFLNVIEVSNSYISKRYSGNIKSNFFGSFATVFSYLSAILAGTLFIKYKSIKTIIIGILPTIAITLIKASKGAILLSVILFLASYGSQKVINKEHKFFSRRTIKPILLYSSLILGILIIAFIAKGGKNLEGADLANYVLGYLQRYSSGHLFAFSDWFEKAIIQGNSLIYLDYNYYPGFFTFMSIFQLLGDTSYVAPGVYVEYFFDGDLRSNIYTIFRGLILDFGIFGSLFFWFFFGLISNYVYFCIRSANYGSLTIVAYPFIVGYFYTSFIISLLIWPTIIFSFFLVVLIFEFSKQKNIF